MTFTACAAGRESRNGAEADSRNLQADLATGPLEHPTLKGAVHFRRQFGRGLGPSVGTEGHEAESPPSRRF